MKHHDGDVTEAVDTDANVRVRFHVMSDSTVAVPKLLTVAEAMEQLGIGKVKIYDLMRAGEIAYVSMPPHTLQSARRIEQAEIEAFIARNRKTAAAS